MAKKKKIEKVEFINCVLCTSSIHIENDLFCKTKMFDETKPSEYAKVSIVKDCSYFRKKQI